VLMTFSVVSSGAAWSQAAQTGSAEKAIAALEEQFTQSERTNNPDLIAPALADKFVATDSDGRFTNKTQFLAGEKATHYTIADFEVLQITVFGSTAIATGTFKTTGTGPEGKPFNSQGRYTDTCEDARWQVAMCCDSLVAHKGVSGRLPIRLMRIAGAQGRSPQTFSLRRVRADGRSI